MLALIDAQDPKAYLYTHVQSGDTEVSLEDDLYSDFPDSVFWHKEPLYSKAAMVNSLEAMIQAQSEPQNHFTQRFSRVE